MAGLLEGKCALVTGVLSNRSIAFGIASAFIADGARLALSFQSEELRARVEPLGSELGAELIEACDLTVPHDLDALAAILERQWGRVDVLVHCIAYAPKEALRGGILDGFSPMVFDQTLSASAASLLALTKGMRPLMRGRGASVLGMTFLGSAFAVPNYNLMGVAKAALEAEVRYLALQLGQEDGTRVNAISAGGVRTIAATGISSFRQILDIGEKYAPLRRNVTIDEVGAAAAFLCSERASAITGEILHVDCGLHCTLPGFTAE